jgi:hypothetical protein
METFLVVALPLPKEEIFLAAEMKEPFSFYEENFRRRHVKVVWLLELQWSLVHHKD